MLDLEKLEKRPVSKLYFVEGFLCQHCERWEPVFFTTLQLQESMKKLAQMSPHNPSYSYHLSKTLKRAEEIQKRGEAV